MSIMNDSAATPNNVSKGYPFGGKRWKRGGMYHISARPHRVVMHQQSAAQLHVQLNGLWIVSRSVRPIGTDAIERPYDHPDLRQPCKPSASCQRVPV